MELHTNKGDKELMKYKDLFENWGLKSLKLNLKFVEAEFVAQPEDQDAAWEMYVELITRVATQFLEPDAGEEESALNSVYSLFETTRSILKEKGRKCESFTKIAVIVLNQVVRPFTAKWHKELTDGFMRKARTEIMSKNTVSGVCLYEKEGCYYIESYKEKENGAFNNSEKCIQFRNELAILQAELRKYTALLANIAGVEDITDINDWRD